MKGDTNWINNYFVLDVSVRFSINRPVRSRLRGELKYKSFPQVVRSKGSKIFTTFDALQLQSATPLESRTTPIQCAESSRATPLASWSVVEMLQAQIFPIFGV